MTGFFFAAWKKTTDGGIDGLVRLFPVLAFVAGVALLSAAYFWTTADSWRNFDIATGSLLLSSGVFAFFLKSYQYMNLFRDELLKIFKNPDFSAVMRDAVYFDDLRSSPLMGVSRTVIHRLLENHSPDLASKVSEYLAAICASADYDYYVESHIRNITILAYDKLTGKVTFRDSLDVKIIPRSKGDKIQYSAEVAGKTVISLEFLKVDGKKENQHLRQAPGLTKYDLELHGQDKYQVARQYLRSYPLHEDPLLHVRFSRFNSHVAIRIRNEVADQITVLLKPNGFLPNDWIYDEEVTSNPAVKSHSAEKSGLTFPGQGYIVMLCPIP